MTKFKGIIFDVDGTLVSTGELIFNSFNFIMKKYKNKTLTTKEILSLFGPTEEQIIDLLFKENPEIVKQDYLSYYSDNHHSVKLYNGIKEILDLCKKRNVILSIYTGKGRKTTEITLKKAGIYDYFDFIVTGDEVENHKPSPEGINLFIEKFRLNKNEVLMIGDAASDIKAAGKAGIKVVSALWDSLAKDEALKLKSDFVFYSVSELRKFIEVNI
jgi:HAD superfamily hydrolase (TIGR01509 family)